MNINNEINLKQAVDKINEGTKVCIGLYAEGVSRSVTNKVSPDLEWELYTLDIIKIMNNRVVEGIAPLLFEPDQLPKLYVFKDKERQLVIDKELSDEELEELLVEVDKEGGVTLYKSSKGY